MTQPALLILGPDTLASARSPIAHQLERLRALAAGGASDLATIGAIRLLAAPRRPGGESAAVYAGALNDLAVLRFSAGDHAASRRLLHEALRIDARHELALANLADVSASAAPEMARWAEGPDAAALPTSLNAWVVEALSLAERKVGFRGQTVLEVSGAIPADAARATGARRWCAGYPEATPQDDGFYEVRAADCRALPYADASFDAVFSSCAFEHVNDMEKALAEIARVMRPGASLVTNFAPIWSCAVGHHLWETDGNGQRIMFLDPIVPHFAHLLLSEAEMRAYLEIVLGSDAARRCARFIYHDTYINRVFEGEFQRFFRAAGFDVSGMERQGKWSADHVPSPEMLAALQHAHPQGGDFTTPGFRGVLVKPRTRVVQATLPFEGDSIEDDFTIGVLP